MLWWAVRGALPLQSWVGYKVIGTAIDLITYTEGPFNIDSTSRLLAGRREVGVRAVPRIFFGYLRYGEEVDLGQVTTLDPAPRKFL